MYVGVREVRSFSMNAEIERREKEQEKKQMKIERELNILDTINRITHKEKQKASERR